MIDNQFLNQKNMLDSLAAEKMHEQKSLFNLNAGEESPSPFMPSPLRGKKAMSIRKLSNRSHLQRNSPQNRIFEEILDRAREMKDKIDTKKTYEEIETQRKLEKELNEDFSVYKDQRIDTLKK